MESLRQQLAETQGKVGKSQRESSCELTQVQTDLGRLRKELVEKVRDAENSPFVMTTCRVM